MGLRSELRATGFRPRELAALVRYRAKARRVKEAMETELDERWRYCYRMLGVVSRSFSLVIMELEPELRHPVCVFYLVLRALDTVEDDTSRVAEERAAVCTEFYTYLDAPQPHWCSDAYGAGAERELCHNFPTVVACYRQLAPAYRGVICDITRRMGAGMAAHIRDTYCESLADYDEYCHYVAGLVGHGLSDLFAASAFEDAVVMGRRELSNSMGLFLQKTNIIRDFLEDSQEARTFWPTEIWGCYGKSLEGLAEPSAREGAVRCLNHMVTDALRHVPHCLAYMRQIRSASVFNFVAIPQVMAIATLAKCYNNGAVFEGKVKIRRSETALLALEMQSMDDVYRAFFNYGAAMLAAVPNEDPSAGSTRKLLNELIDECQPHVAAAPPDMIIPNVLALIAFGGLSSYVLKRRQEHFDGAVFTWRSAGGIMEPLDMLAIGALFIVCIYMFGFFLLPYMAMMQKAEVRRLEQRRLEHERAGSPASSLDGRMPTSPLR